MASLIPLPLVKQSLSAVLQLQALAFASVLTRQNVPLLSGVWCCDGVSQNGAILARNKNSGMNEAVICTHTFPPVTTAVVSLGSPVTIN